MKMLVVSIAASFITVSCAHGERLFNSDLSLVTPCYRGPATKPICDSTYSDSTGDWYEAVHTEIGSSDNRERLVNYFENPDQSRETRGLKIFGNTLCSDQILNSCFLRQQFADHGLEIDRWSPFELQQLVVYVYLQASNGSNFQSSFQSLLAELGNDRKLETEMGEKLQKVGDCTEWSWGDVWETERVFWTEVEAHNNPVREPIAHLLEFVECKSEHSTTGGTRLVLYDRNKKDWIPASRETLKSYAIGHPELYEEISEMLGD